MMAHEMTFLFPKHGNREIVTMSAAETQGEISPNPGVLFAWLCSEGGWYASADSARTLMPFKKWIGYAARDRTADLSAVRASAAKQLCALFQVVGVAAIAVVG